VRRAVLALLPFLAIPIPVVVHAQAAALPDAKVVLADYVKAIGGAETYAKLQSIHSTGTFTLPALGVGGTIEIFNARPANTLMHIAIDGVGEIKRGVSGTVAWSVDPFEGAKVLSGAENVAALQDAEFGSATRGADAYKSVETVGKAFADGHECYNLKLVGKDDRIVMNCYATDTRLIVQSVRTAPSPEGDMQVTTTMRAYKPFGGVMMPTEMVINAGGQEQVVTISNVEVNTVPASTFELPAEIKAIAK
jgi:hypothetical protein